MTTSGRTLLSPSDIADVAGVKRPVVSNWRKRYGDFPAPAGGTEARPLFSRAEVVQWLRSRGRKIQTEGAGDRLWGAVNAVRDRMPIERAVDTILTLATLKRASGAEFAAIASGESVDQTPLLTRASDSLRTVSPLHELAWTPIASHPDSMSLALLADSVHYTEDEDLADAVDFILERLARWQVKSGAESGFIGSRTSLLLAELAQASEGTVYDPACGIANVLVSTAQSGAAERRVGCDIDPESLRIAAQRAILHRVNLELTVGDVLYEDPHPGLEADVVVAEPPFSARWDPARAASDPRFSFGLAPRNRADLAWVEHAIAHLAPGGRAFVLTPQGTLFGSGAERQIRGNLLAEGCIEAVVALPPRMLPHTAIPLALWVLRPRGESKRVLLIDATKVTDAESQVPAWLTTRQGSTTGLEVPHARVPITEILATDANLTPSRWLGEHNVDRGSIAVHFAQASQSVSDSFTDLKRRRPNLEGIADLAASQVKTIRDLIDSEILELRTGRPDRTRDLSLEVTSRIVRASDVKSGQLPAPTGTAPDLPDLTEKDDVLVTTMHEVRATVDRDGGHLPSTGVARLRVTTPTELLPEYLATVLPGPWNARFQAGTTIQRAHIRELEIPLIPPRDQARVISALSDLERLQLDAEQLSANTRELRRSILESVRHSVPLDLDGRTRLPTPSHSDTE